MIVFRWGTLAGVLLFAVLVAALVCAVVQERELFVRAFEFVGRGARIGVIVVEIEGDDAKVAKSGVVVESVSTGSPAEKAGIKVGDAITEFDGERVRSVMQFSCFVQEMVAGWSVVVVFSRGGQCMIVNVTLETRTLFDDFNMRLFDLLRVLRIIFMFILFVVLFVSSCFFLFVRGGRFGIMIEVLDDQLAEYFGVKDGVLVKLVIMDSVVQKVGLKVGDVIIVINGSKVYEMSDVS